MGRGQAQVQAQGIHELEAGLVQAGLHSSTFITMTCYTKTEKSVADPVMRRRKEKTILNSLIAIIALFSLCDILAAP